MATPSVLTVPSMYGDGILYSGPSAYGPELASQPVDLQTDFANNSGGTITSANTFDTVGGSFDGIASQLSAFSLTVGTTYEIEIRGITTSNGFTLGDLATTGNQYGSGFGVHRFVSLNTRLWIRQNNTTGTTTITHFSIRQVTQGSDFDFTRATTGTRINEDGYIEDVPYNFTTYSEEIENKTSASSGGGSSITATNNFAIAPNGTLTAGRLQCTAGSNYALKGSIITPSSAGQKFNMSVYIKSNTSSDQNIIFYGRGTQSSANVIKATNEWIRYDFTGTATVNFFSYLGVRTDLGSDSSCDILVWGWQISKGDKIKNHLPTTDRVNLPRLNYPTYGGCPSLLMEEQRTNSITYNSQLDNPSYTSANLTISANQINSPEGILNADKLTETTANGIHYVGQGVTSALAGTYTFSGFLKKGTSNFAGIRAVTNGFTNRFFANLDLTTGEITSTSTLGSSVTWSYGVEEYSNGWFRLYITGTHSSGNLDISFGLSNSASPSYSLGFPTYTGSTSNFVYAYGFQVEVGSYPTSLIHTSGATVTRNQDVAENAGLGTTDTFNSSEGVLYLESKAFIASDTNRFISISDGSYNNVISLYYSTVNNQIVARTWAGGSSIVLLTSTLQDVTQFHKIAFSYKSGNYKFYIDGVKLQNDTNASVPTGLNQLDFFQGAGGNNFFAKVKGLAVYKTALTDTELANLTSYNNHDLFIPYRSRMQMISADQELQCTEHDITRFL